MAAGPLPANTVTSNAPGPAVLPIFGPWVEVLLILTGSAVLGVLHINDYATVRLETSP